MYLRSMKSGISSTVGGRLRERKLSEKNENGTVLRTQKLRDVRKNETEHYNQTKQQDDDDSINEQYDEDINEITKAEIVNTNGANRNDEVRCNKVEDDINVIEATWMKPAKTMRLKNNDDDDDQDKIQDSNKYSILAENEDELEVNYQNKRNEGKKQAKGIVNNANANKEYFWDDSDEDTVMKDENVISGNKRTHDTDSDEDNIIQTKTQKSNEVENIDMTIERKNISRNEDDEYEKGKFDTKILKSKQTHDENKIYNEDEKMDHHNANDKTNETNNKTNEVCNDLVNESNRNKNKNGIEKGDEIDASVRKNVSNEKNDERDDNAGNVTKISARATEYEGTVQKKEDPGVIMKYRGEQMVEDTITKSTKVTIEFNPNKNVQIFNVRTETMNLLNVMWHTDNAIKVVSRETGDTWGPQDKFPAEKAFMKHFLVNEEETKYNTTKVYVHVSVISTEDIARIKWRPEVRNYIFNNNIWVKEDTFNSQITSTPGYFVGVHPRATHRGEFTSNIEKALEEVTIDDKNRIVNEWKRRNNNSTLIPKFKIQTGVRKWGQIHTEVLNVECAKKEAQYLKYLLSCAVEQELLYDCVFIPIGIHLMKSSNVLSSLLRQHNQLLMSLRTFDIYGLFPTMLQKTTKENKESILTKINECGMIKRMERTSVTEAKGIWTVVVEKDNVEASKRFLNEIIPNCTEKPNYTTNFKSYDRKYTNNESGVDKYADFLEKLAAVDEDTPNATNITEFDVSPTLSQGRSYRSVLLKTNDTIKK